MANDVAATLVALAKRLSHELDHKKRPRRNNLDSSLDRDWGFDSLARAELLLRVSRSLGVDLPERLLREADTLRDILDALPEAERQRAHAIVPPPIAAPEGAEPVPEDVPTLTEVLDWHVHRHGGHDHLIIETDADREHLTYGELAEAARRVACSLRQYDVSPGDRVAIMLPTGRDFFCAFYGVLYAAAVPVPIYPAARPAQIGEHMRRQAGILRNAGSVVLIADGSAQSLADLLGMQVPSLRSVRTVSALTDVDFGPLPVAKTSDTALIQYTSGSTGDPKGVVLTHANLLANIRAMGAVIQPTSSDVFVSWLPLYHDMGLIGAWLGSLHYGVPLVVMSPQRFLLRPERWLWAIHRFRGTLSAAPNFAFELCLRKIDDAALAGLDLSSLRMIANGAEPVSPMTIRRFTKRFAPYGFKPGTMAPVYGLAENAVGLAFPPIGRTPIIDKVDRKALSGGGYAAPPIAGATDIMEIVACGRPLPGHQIRIVGATGELSDRQEGRLQFCGRSATSGYFRNPKKNHDLFDGQWLNSGDLAYVSKGDVFITGRSKDIIIRAGQHIYPQEIEDAVGGVRGVRKGCVAAFAGTDLRAGTERLVVVAETRETETGALAALTATVGETITQLSGAPPDEIIFVPPQTVPKTSSGKIRRAAARQLHERGALGQRRSSSRMQIIGLALSGALSRLSRVKRAAAEVTYAGYWWTVVFLFGAVTWPLVVALPSKAARWGVMHTMCRALLWTLGVRVSVQVLTPPPEHALLASNHASYLDGLILATVFPGELTFVAKQELAPQSVAGPFLRALGALFVERQDPAAGVEGERAIYEAAKCGKRVIMFPEGTFKRAPGLLPFHLGTFTIAARASVPIVPVAISGTRSILRGSQWFPRRGTVSVRVGKAIAPRATDFAAAVQLRDAVRAEILAACGEPELLEL